MPEVMRVNEMLVMAGIPPRFA